MDWDNIAPMIVVVTLFLSIAGVLILRPLTKRLGDLIEITSRRQQGETRREEVTRLTEVIGRLADRLEHLEQRQDFTDQLVVSLERPARARLAEQEDC
jgi:CRP-like cAMP-binding protein